MENGLPGRQFARYSAVAFGLIGFAADHAGVVDQHHPQRDAQILERHGVDRVGADEVKAWCINVIACGSCSSVPSTRMTSAGDRRLCAALRLRSWFWGAKIIEYEVKLLENGSNYARLTPLQPQREEASCPSRQSQTVKSAGPE